MRSISNITEKMIAYSKGDLHDIHHFLQVWAYAKTIGELEGLEEETQFILETATGISAPPPASGFCTRFSLQPIPDDDFPGALPCPMAKRL